jgi:hypothetical protein
MVWSCFCNLLAPKYSDIFIRNCLSSFSYVLIICFFPLSVLLLYGYLCVDRIMLHILYMTERLQKGFGLVIAFSGRLQVVTINNYCAVANSHTLQFITERTKYSRSAVSSPVVC